LNCKTQQLQYSLSSLNNSKFYCNIFEIHLDLAEQCRGNLVHVIDTWESFKVHSCSAIKIHQVIIISLNCLSPCDWWKASTRGINAKYRYKFSYVPLQ